MRAWHIPAMKRVKEEIMTQKKTALAHIFMETEAPWVATSHSWAEIMWAPDKFTQPEKRLSDSWLRARPIQQDTPELQLWRIERVHAPGPVEQLGQVTYAVMLEKLKAEELRIAKEAGMTGSDDEIVAERLKVAGRNNVLRVIADGKVSQAEWVKPWPPALTAGFAVAAAGILFTGSDAPVPVTPVPVKDTPPAQRVDAQLPSAQMTGVVDFDYSSNNGYYTVGDGDRSFGISFSKASDNSIYVLNHHHTTDRVARVKDAVPGCPISFHTVDSSSRYYVIRTGETFMMKNKQGYYMQARIRAIADDTRGAAADKVVFEYQINAEKHGNFVALADGKEQTPAQKSVTAQPRP